VPDIVEQDETRSWDQLGELTCRPRRSRITIAMQHERGYPESARPFA
jgi:hypothetical protein